MTRITQSMIYRQSLEDIRRNLLSSTRLQSQIASGMRIQRPSDDPAAMLRMFPLQNEIRDLDQSLDNIALARETLNTGTAALEDASAIMQRVRELTVQGANGAMSDNDRRSLGEEVDQIIGQMLSVANSSRAGRYIFGGTATDSPPFEIGANGESVSYRGNERTLSVEVAPSVDTELNRPGDSIFQNHRRGETTFEGDTGARSGAGFDTGVGVDRLSVTFSGLTIPSTITGLAQGAGETTVLGPMHYTFTAPDQLQIDGGAVTTVTNGENLIQVGDREDAFVSLAITLPISPATGTFTSRARLSIDGGATSTEADFTNLNVRVTDPSDGSALNVDVTELRSVGTERVRYEGTFDAFSTLIALRDILRNEEGAPQATVAQRLTDSLGDIDEAHEQILTAVRDLGFRSQNMSLLENRVEGLQLNTTESLSLVRDTDIVESMLDYQRQDTLYQASLRVSANLVQISLLDYLR